MAAFVAKQMMGSKLNAVKGQMNVGGGQSEAEPEEEADPERLEAVREAEEQRRLKHQRMEEEREKLRQGIRDKYGLQKKEDEEEEEENPLTDDNRPAEIEVDDFTRWKNTLEAHLGGIRQTIESKSEGWKRVSPPLEVRVLRQDKLINHLFTIFVVTVVTINYINFGCALEMDVVREVLRRPVGPAVGFACQFVVMPLVSYGVGYWLFDDPVLRLGLFTFGCSPGGGASNMWTVLLGGNLNLSITMTFISTVAAFGTLPLWLFTLGRTILQDTDIVVPYSNIMYSLVGLVVPLALGLLVQRFFPKVAARSKRLLAPICIVLLIGIIVLAIVANTYIFSLLGWRMVLAASLSVWSGFLAGTLVSAAFGFPSGDVVAVAVETGVQNSGIAFVLLSYSLAKPVSDMAAVVPVAGSMITPVPLTLLLCLKKLRSCCCSVKDQVELQTLHGTTKKEEYQSTKDKEQEGSELKEVKAE